VPYTPQQRALINLSLRLTRKDPPAIRRALLMAGLVEKSLTHTPGGHSTSMGWLQQRPDMGWGPFIPGLRGARIDAQQFLQRARRNYRQGIRNPGRLAQSVQRSAFPERYGQRAGQVNEILRSAPRLIGTGALAQAGPQQMAQQRMQGPDLARMRQLAQIIGVPYAGQLVGQLGASGAVRTAKARTGPRTLPGTARMTARYGPAKAGRTVPFLEQLVAPTGARISSRDEGHPGDGVHTKTSWHYKGRAVDVVGTPAQLQAIADIARKNPRAFKELFWDRLGWYIKNGRIYRGSIGGHGDHLHLAR
jgi:hypothetical protein